MIFERQRFDPAVESGVLHLIVHAAKLAVICGSVHGFYARIPMDSTGQVLDQQARALVLSQDSALHQSMRLKVKQQVPGNLRLLSSHFKAPLGF